MDAVKANKKVLPTGVLILDGQFFYLWLILWSEEVIWPDRNYHT